MSQILMALPEPAPAQYITGKSILHTSQYDQVKKKNPKCILLSVRTHRCVLLLQNYSKMLNVENGLLSSEMKCYLFVKILPVSVW